MAGEGFGAGFAAAWRLLAGDAPLPEGFGGGAPDEPVGVQGPEGAGAESVLDVKKLGVLSKLALLPTGALESFLQEQTLPATDVFEDIEEGLIMTEEEVQARLAEEKETEIKRRQAVFIEKKKQERERLGMSAKEIERRRKLNKKLREEAKKRREKSKDLTPEDIEEKAEIEAHKNIARKRRRLKARQDLFEHEEKVEEVWGRFQSAAENKALLELKEILIDHRNNLEEHQETEPIDVSNLNIMMVMRILADVFGEAQGRKRFAIVTGTTVFLLNRDSIRKLRASDLFERIFDDGPITVADSADDLIASMLDLRTLVIQRLWDATPERKFRARNRGGEFGYTCDSHQYPLDKFQIYKSTTIIPKPEICFLHCLRTLKAESDLLLQLRLVIHSDILSINNVRDLAMKFGFRLQVTVGDYRQGGLHKRVHLFGTTGPTFKVACLNTHYFLNNERLGITRYAFQNNLKKEDWRVYKLRSDGRKRIVREGDESKNIWPFDAVRFLLENKDQYLTESTRSEAVAAELTQERIQESICKAMDWYASTDCGSKKFNFQGNPFEFNPKKIPDKIWVYDFESVVESTPEYPWHRPYMVCASRIDLKTKKIEDRRTFKGPTLVQDFLNIMKDETCVAYAHWHSYDLQFIIPDLNRIQQFLSSGSKVMMAKATNFTMDWWAENRGKKKKKKQDKRQKDGQPAKKKRRRKTQNASRFIDDAAGDETDEEFEESAGDWEQRICDRYYLAVYDLLDSEEGPGHGADLDKLMLRIQKENPRELKKPKPKKKKIPTIVFKDSFSMISERLGEFGKMFGLSQAKEVMPYSIYGQNIFEDEWVNLRKVIDCTEFKDPTTGDLDRKKWSQFLSNCFNWGCFDEDDMEDSFTLNARCEELTFDEEDDFEPLFFNAVRYSEEYCRIDVEVLGEGLLKFREWMQDATKLDLFGYLSLPSLGHAHFTNIGCYDGCYKLGGISRTFAQGAVIGGRTMLANNIKCHFEGPEVRIGCIDANSLYPAAVVLYGGSLKGKPKLFTEEIMTSMTRESWAKITGAIMDIKVMHFPHHTN